MQNREEGTTCESFSVRFFTPFSGNHNLPISFSKFPLIFLLTQVKAVIGLFLSSWTHNAYPSFDDYDAT